MELAPSGKARLIPITILVDGKFYDASAYKADPVPMAVAPNTVYEAVRDGASQGLFTVTSAQELRGAWSALGSWQPAGTAAKASAPIATKPRGMDDEDAPPVLRRPGSEKQKPESKPDLPPAAPPPAQTPSAPPTPPEEDKDRPVLRRGQPATPPMEEPALPAASTAAKKPTPTASASPKGMQLLPAISDTSGPEFRPYNYGLKPEEEQSFRKRMLALAATEVRVRLAQFQPAPSVPPPSGKAPASKRKTGLAVPSFEEVQLRIFDVSSSNEPILVLTALARLPEPVSSPQAASRIPAASEYYVTLVTRADIYGELRKLLSVVTDTRHLDAFPRLELIDAVDVDGDNRGELLFRQFHGTGTSYVVYRVGADHLWPLFDGSGH